MEMLDRIGGDYGKQRLYGAVGYGIGGYMAGVTAAAVGIAWCLNMVVALSCISLVLLLNHIPSFQRTKPKMEFLQSLAHILQQRDVLVLFVLVLVIGVIAQLIDSFLFLFLFNLSGNNSNLVGVVIAVETTSELPLFFHANRIINRLGTPCCIFMGVTAYAIRLLAYALVTNPWTILPIEALHGVTFGLVWAAFTNYVYNSAPEGTAGTMIGLLAAVQKGVGGGIGTLVGGWVYQNYGARTMWIIALVGVLPFALFIAIAFYFLAKSHTTSKLSDLEDLSIKRCTPSYGTI
jgi:predicted MFS family arabinose efflux permease